MHEVPFVFEYVNHRGVHASRSVEPVQVVFCSTEHHGEIPAWHLKAWCHDRKGFRYFLLDQLQTRAAIQERGHLMSLLRRARHDAATAMEDLETLLAAIEGEESDDRLVLLAEKIRAKGNKS